MSTPDPAPSVKGGLSEKLKRAFGKLTPGRKTAITYAEATTDTLPSQMPQSTTETLPSQIPQAKTETLPSQIPQATTSPSPTSPKPAPALDTSNPTVGKVATKPEIKECSVREANLSDRLYVSAAGGDDILVEEALQDAVPADLPTAINLQTHTGRTPLMVAALNGHRAIVEKLLDRGALPHLTGAEKKTARDFAVERRHVEIVAMLELRLHALKKLRPELALAGTGPLTKTEPAPMTKSVAMQFEERTQRVQERHKRVSTYFSSSRTSRDSYATSAPLYTPEPSYRPVTTVAVATDVVTYSTYPESRILAQYPGVCEKGSVDWRRGDTHSTSSMYRPRIQGPPIKSLASYPSAGSKW